MKIRYTAAAAALAAALLLSGCTGPGKPEPESAAPETQTQEAPSEADARETDAVIPPQPVRPESTQAETEEETKDPTAVTEADEAALRAMLPVFDSVIRCGTENGTAYLPEDPEYVWTVLYYLTVNYMPPEGEDVWFSGEDGNLNVRPAVILREARALFEGLEELPQIPGGLSVSYDADPDAYVFMMSDASQDYTEIEGYALRPDGCLEAEVSYGPDKEDRKAFVFLLRKNTEAAEGQLPYYPLRVRSAEAETP